MWALARTGVVSAADDGKDDKIPAYVLLATSWDKTLATTAAFTSIRVVCQNTLFFAQEDIKKERRPQVKVPHNLRFDPARVKQELGLMDEAWSGFLKKVRAMAGYQLKPEAASSFFRQLLQPKKEKPLSNKAPLIKEPEARTTLKTSRAKPRNEVDRRSQINGVL